MKLTYRVFNGLIAAAVLCCLFLMVGGFIAGNREAVADGLVTGLAAALLCYAVNTMRIL